MLVLHSKVRFVITALLAVIPVMAQAESVAQPTIAIVIDDLGHSLSKGNALIDLPYPMTMSILPGRKYTKELAERAHLSGKEVMLHAPMETEHRYDLGAGALTLDMPKIHIQSSLLRSLADIPYIRGVNNHMGSAFTSNEQAMKWVMETLSQHPFFFLDSKTSADSVAAHIAHEHGIPTLVRDVFLDHEQSMEFIEQQFDRLLQIARRKGFAIAIGHPHTNTQRFLEKRLISLGEEGISMATASGIWQIIHPQRHMFPGSGTQTARNVANTGEI